MQDFLLHKYVDKARESQKNVIRHLSDLEYYLNFDIILFCELTYIYIKWRAIFDLNSNFEDV